MWNVFLLFFLLLSSLESKLTSAENLVADRQWLNMNFYAVIEVFCTVLCDITVVGVRDTTKHTSDHTQQCGQSRSTFIYKLLRPLFHLVLTLHTQNFCSLFSLSISLFKCYQ